MMVQFLHFLIYSSKLPDFCWFFAFIACWFTVLSRSILRCFYFYFIKNNIILYVPKVIHSDVAHLVALYVLTLYVKIYTFWRNTFRRLKFSRYTFSIYTFSRWIISLFQIFAKSLYSTLAGLSGAVSGTYWRSL